MKRAFPWLFRNFAVGFLLVFALQILVLAVGVRFALSGYADRQRQQMETIARNILLNPRAEYDEALRYSNPFFVFSADGNLLFSNRGRGRSIPESDLEPVRYDGVVIGRYYAGEMRFIDNEANRVFLVTLLSLAAGSLLASIAIGLLVAVLASRRIAGPVGLLQADIHSIESRTRVDARRFSISELSEISRALETLSTLLANEEEYKRQWMQDIAHDLRTPISGLKGQIEGMRDGVLDPSLDRFEKNLAEIERLEGLVHGVSELYAVESSRRLDYTEFDAKAFVDEALSPHELTARERGISVAVNIEVDRLAGDRELLSRAVGNVVSNAFAYIDDGGTVSIDVLRIGGEVRISVADDGPGIPPDKLERVFDRFFRGEYARYTEGTGLGLNIAQAAVRRHRGSIKAENRIPRGAVFTISLPAVSPTHR